MAGVSSLDTGRLWGYYVGSMKLPRIQSIPSKLFDLFTLRQKRNSMLLFFTFFVLSLFQVVGVASVFPFIQLVMNPGIVEQQRVLKGIYDFLGFRSIEGFITAAGSAMFILVVLSNAVSAGTTWIKSRFIMGLNHSLSEQLLSVYLLKPYAFFLNRNTSELGKNILMEVSQLTSGVLMPLFELLINGFMITAMVVFLFVVDTPTTLIALSVLGGGYLVVNILVKNRLRQSGDQRMEANRQRFKTTSEALSGIKAAKISGREGYFIRRYGVFSRRFSRLIVRERVASDIPRYLLEAVAFGGVVLLVLFLVSTKQSVQEAIPLVSLFAFAGYRMMPAMHSIHSALTRIYFNQAILDTLHDDMFGQNADLPNPAEKIPFEDSIQIQKLSFSYPESKEHALKDISLSIRKNTSIGFAGATGSGKTTLVDLIMGLLDPTEGQITIDGTALKEETKRGWQEHIGYVPQDIYLSDDTVLKNIAFGIDDRDIDINRVTACAADASLHEFISQELPEGYDTVIGERGVRLSGGQRQRIGLARALYDNPDVLVLDEATSALDGVTETEVINAITGSAGSRTIIMIAHRLTTVKDCDVIYLLDRGRIIDSGTYEELMQHSSQFIKMARVQHKV